MSDIIDMNNVPRTWSPCYQNIADLVVMLLSQCRELDHQQMNTVHNALMDMFPSDKSKGMIIGHGSDKEPKIIASNTLEMAKVESENISTSQTSGGVWIVKPVGLSCGEKIIIARGLLQTLLAVDSFRCKCIVQKYIEHPLLVRNGRKFDIRQWILVTSLSPLRIFGFSECYLRLSSKNFSLEKLDDQLVHLTNHAIQKFRPQEEHHDNINLVGEEQCDTMMTQAEFVDSLGSDIFYRVILPQIKNLCVASVLSVRDRLEDPFEPKCGLEWLGVDLMVDENTVVKLIEVNTSPDISHSTVVTARLVDKAVEDLCRLVLDDSRTRSPSDEAVVPEPNWSLWFDEEVDITNLEPVLQFSSRKRQKATLKVDCQPADAFLFHSFIERITPILDNNRRSKTTASTEEDEI